MAKVKISIPNDYNSEEDYAEAVENVYGVKHSKDCGEPESDCPACEAVANDDGRDMYDELATIAENAGLSFVEATDFGAIWKGEKAQIAKCKKALPTWAYVGEIEE